MDFACCRHTSIVVKSALHFTHVFFFWATLGRPPDSCEKLASLNPRLTDNGLVCNVSHGMSPGEAREMLYTEMLDLMGVHQKAENRFFNNGPVSRDTLCLVCLGIDQIVDMVSKDPTTENTYLNGWRFFDKEIRITVAWNLDSHCRSTLS